MYFALKVETKLQNTWWYTAWSTWNNQRATLRRRSVRHERITSCKNRVIRPQQKKKEAEGKWEVDARCAQLKWHGNWSRVHREGMCLMKCNNTVPVGLPPSQPVNQWVCFMVGVPLLHYSYVVWYFCQFLDVCFIVFSSLCVAIWLNRQMSLPERHSSKKLLCHCDELIRIK